ncbi:MAG: phage holin family protein [Akkermansiaceae bacterium]
MEKAPPSADQSAKEDDTSVMKLAVSEFVSARLELAAIEAKEAAEFTVRKVVSAVILALCAFFIWALLLAGLTGLLAGWAQEQLAGHLPGVSGWVIVLFALAIIHTLVAIILIWVIKKKPAAPLFELTRQEIENDKQWAKSNK